MKQKIDNSKCSVDRLMVRTIPSIQPTTTFGFSFLVVLALKLSRHSLYKSILLLTSESVAV